MERMKVPSYLILSYLILSYPILSYLTACFCCIGESCEVGLQSERERDQADSKQSNRVELNSFTEGCRGYVNMYYKSCTWSWHIWIWSSYGRCLVILRPQGRRKVHLHQHVLYLCWNNYHISSFVISLRPVNTCTHGMNVLWPIQHVSLISLAYINIPFLPPTGTLAKDVQGSLKGAADKMTNVSMKGWYNLQSYLGYDTGGAQGNRSITNGSETSSYQQQGSYGGAATNGSSYGGAATNGAKVGPLFPYPATLKDL